MALTPAQSTSEGWEEKGEQHSGSEEGSWEAVRECVPCWEGSAGAGRTPSHPSLLRPLLPQEGLLHSMGGKTSSPQKELSEEGSRDEILEMNFVSDAKRETGEGLEWLCQDFS